MIKVVEIEDKGLRLDKYLSFILPDLSRTKIQTMIKDGEIKVNGNAVKVGYKTAVSDEVFIPEIESTGILIKKENIDLEIIAELKDYIVINKPARMVVHPSETGDKSGTVVNALVDKIEDGVGESFRPGVVHRLDKDTSGVLVVAKTRKGYDYLIEKFKSRDIEKVYLVLVRGHLDHKKGIIDSPIGRAVLNRKKMAIVSEVDGKNAISIYKVLEEFSVNGVDLSLLEVEIKTGRTHQIRVHMNAIGHSVVGDVTYGLKSFNNRFSEVYGLDRQFLHAYKIGFDDIETGKKKEYTAKLPLELEEVLSQLREA